MTAEKFDSKKKKTGHSKKVIKLGEMGNTAMAQSPTDARIAIHLWLTQGQWSAAMFCPPINTGATGTSQKNRAVCDDGTRAQGHQDERDDRKH